MNAGTMQIMKRNPLRHPRASGLIAALLVLVTLATGLAQAAPTVSLTAPANNAKYLAPATFNVSASATASSGTTISKVEFYQGTTLIGTDSSSPYSISWASVPAGTYSLTAKATDSVGGVTTSAARSITINASNTPPTVSLTAPANNSKYLTPASLTVSASASGVEVNTPITQVEFYANGTLIGTDTTSPYSIAWASPPAGTYSLTAKATDSAGGITTSTATTVTITASDTPPTVSLTAPANNAKYLAPANVTLTASASGVEANTPISQVEFLDGSTVLATLTASPYTFVWNNAPVGTHSLTAKATDSGGGITTSAARSITVSATNTPPTVSLTAPANNATVQAPVDVLVSASATAPEVNDTLSKVEFYQGTTLIGSASASPWQITWVKPAAGVYSLTAKATDAQGATTSSAARTLTVLANSLPSVSLTSPANTQRFTAPASIALAATASDPGGSITRVEFYQGTTLIGTATTAPYGATWNNVPAGNYSLTAKATDNGGAETYSAAVAVTVTSPGATLYYLHSDHLDTPRLVTDEQNKIVWRYSPLSEPFGLSPPEEDPDGDGKNFTMNLRFPGQYADKESNTNYNYFRDYNPEIGRYIQSDPIGLQGGINTYSYVGGNPLRWTDPRGLDNPGMGPYGPGPNRGDGSMSPVQVVGAMGDFQRNYNDMRDANTIGGDKYFHCMANCQATRRGPAGESAACKISDTREWTDQNIKGDPASASLADQAANAIGRSEGLASSQPCSAVCGGFRPNGLPARY